MSIGFPHDPFHQIVNVHWSSEKIAAKMFFAAFAKVGGQGQFCSPSTEWPGPPNQTQFWSGGYDISAGAALVDVIQRWEKDPLTGEFEWEDEVEADFTVSGVPVTLPIISEQTWGAWEWLFSTPDLSDPNRLDWEPLTGAVIQSPPLPTHFTFPGQLPEMKYVNGTSATLFVRSVPFVSGPICVGLPLGGGGSEVAELGEYQRVPSSEISMSFVNLRLTENASNPATKKTWAPMGIWVYDESPTTSSTGVFISLLFKRVPNP